MSDEVDGEVTTIVIDSGSGVTRAGFSGDDAPRAEFSSVIGTPKHQVVMKNMVSSSEKSAEYIGEFAQMDRGILSLRHPMEHGLVRSWDDMEKIWHHTFYNELRVDPQDHPVLLSEPPLSPNVQKEKMAEIMFEKFNVPGLYVTLQSTLTLYASGRHGGLVVDIGDGVTQITPSMGIYAWKHAMKRSHLAGRELTHYLATLLNERGYYFDTTAEMEVVREIKEKLAYVAGNYEDELETAMTSSKLESTYELPDGHSITIGNEKFRCAEALFKPSLIGVEQPGLSELIYQTIMKTDINCRSHFYTNIILSGGTTLLPGIEDRLTKELKELVPPTKLVKVVSSPERKYSVWIGGSILSSLSTFNSIVVLRKDYDEHGPYYMHKKCV